MEEPDLEESIIDLYTRTEQVNDACHSTAVEQQPLAECSSGWSLTVGEHARLDHRHCRRAGTLPAALSVNRFPQMTELLNNLPTELVEVLGYDDIVTGAESQATFFGLLGYVLIVIATTAWGAAFIAGAEETGRLNSPAHAVGRVQYAVESIQHS